MDTNRKALPNMLQEANTDVISQSYCQELWSPTPIGDYHVCLLDTEFNDAGACNVCEGPRIRGGGKGRSELTVYDGMAVKLHENSGVE